jgi:unsaturated rhamnogalacturonyl hydrolase
LTKSSQPLIFSSKAGWAEKRMVWRTGPRNIKFSLWGIVMKVHFKGITLIFLVLIFQKVSAKTEFDADSIVNIMKRVAHYRMTYADIGSLFNHASANKGDKPNPWETMGKGVSWDVGSFFIGLMALYYTSKDTTYLNFGKRWATTFGWNSIDRASYNEINGKGPHADHQCCFQTYCEIYLLDPQSANNFMITNAGADFVAVFDQIKLGPTLNWWWCEALYMAPPAIARYCKASNQNRFLDSLNSYWWATSDYIYNSTQKFWYRDAGFKGSNTFWSAGNAFAIGGLVRVLDYMPATYANRARFETQFKEMSAAIKAQQGFTSPYDGMWTTHMLDHTGFPGPESIGTAFFCYAFAWGVRNKLLDSAMYTPSINKAWRDLVKNVKPEDGRLLRCQHVSGGPTNMETNGDLNNSAPEGEGAFLLAGSEMYLRAQKTAPAAQRTAASGTIRSSLGIRGSCLTFTCADPARSSLRIYATNGRCAADLTGSLRRMKAGPNSLHLRAAGLAFGVYSAVLADDYGEAARSFVIQ